MATSGLPAPCPPTPCLERAGGGAPSPKPHPSEKRASVVPVTQRTELEKAAEEGESPASRPRAGRRSRWERDLLQEPRGCTRAPQPPAAARPRRCSAASGRAGMEPGAGEVAPSTGTCPEGSRARNSPAPPAAPRCAAWSLRHVNVAAVSDGRAKTTKLVPFLTKPAPGVGGRRGRPLR